MGWSKKPTRHTYDSGLLEIGPLLTGYVSGSLFLHRTGPLVQLSMRQLVMAAGSAGILYRLPDSFKPLRPLMWNQREDFSASGPRVIIEQTGALNFVGIPSGVPLYSVQVFLTRQDVPAAAPGEVVA